MSVNGTVKFFNADKGYGFIKPDQGEKDIFVHASELSKSKIETLGEGQRVSFTPVPAKNGKGDRATDLALI